MPDGGGVKVKLAALTRTKVIAAIARKLVLAIGASESKALAYERMFTEKLISKLELIAINEEGHLVSFLRITLDWEAHRFHLEGKGQGGLIMSQGDDIMKIAPVFAALTDYMEKHKHEDGKVTTHSAIYPRNEECDKILAKEFGYRRDHPENIFRDRVMANLQLSLNEAQRFLRVEVTDPNLPEMTVSYIRPADRSIVDEVDQSPG